MSNKIIPGVIAIVTVIVLIGSALMPIISDFNDTTLVRYNNVEQVLSKAEKGVSEVEITFDPANPTKTNGYYVNGEPISVVANKLIFASEKLHIFGYTGLTLIVDNGDGTATEYAPLTQLSYVVNGPENSITVIFAVNGEESQTVTYDYGSWGFTMDPNGDHTNMVIWTNRTVYLNDINQLYLVNSRVTDVYIAGNGDQITAGSESITANVTKNTIDNVDNIFYLNLTPSPSTTDYSYTYDDVLREARYIVVPIEVYGEKIPEHNWASLMYVIPAVILIALLALAVGMIRRY